MDDLTLYAVLWIVCAIGAFVVANSRNDPNPTLWAVIGLLLGPIGLLLAFVAARGRKETPPSV